MAAQKKTATTTPAGLHALRIGSRVRCTDDGAEGRIVWANGVSVKIKWDDGEQVTWRRDSLAGRPIEIMAGDDASPAETSAAPESDAPAAAVEATPESQAAEAPPEEATAAQTPPAAPESAEEPPTAETPADEPTAAPTPPSANDAAPAAGPDKTDHSMPGSANDRKRRRAHKAAAAAAKKAAAIEPKEKKLSAIDAAARVLAEAGQPMTCQEMIGAMAVKGYWTSPGGKTPAATLYSASLREVTTKGEQARFAKTGPGRFARRGA